MDYFNPFPDYCFEYLKIKHCGFGFVIAFHT